MYKEILSISLVDEEMKEINRKYIVDEVKVMNKQEICVLHI